MRESEITFRWLALPYDNDVRSSKCFRSTYVNGNRTILWCNTSSEDFSKCYRIVALPSKICTQCVMCGTMKDRIETTVAKLRMENFLFYLVSYAYTIILFADVRRFNWQKKFMVTINSADLRHVTRASTSRFTSSHWTTYKVSRSGTQECFYWPEPYM